MLLSVQCKCDDDFVPTRAASIVSNQIIYSTVLPHGFHFLALFLRRVFEKASKLQLFLLTDAIKRQKVLCKSDELRKLMIFFLTLIFHNFNEYRLNYHCKCKIFTFQVFINAKSQF